MNLTIEKAKEIVNHPENYCDIGPLGHAQTWKAKGFIEGWNQAIEKCAGIVDRQLNIESETGGDEELNKIRNMRMDNINLSVNRIVSPTVTSEGK